MNKKTILLAVILIFFMLNTAAAMNLQKGMFQYQWGESASNHIYLREKGNKDEVTYYSHPGEVYTVGDVIVDKEIYGFYKDQLFGVYFNIDSLDVYDKMVAHLKAQYGLPTSKLTENQLYVLKWKEKDVTIKVKMDKITQKMKIAFYYQPLSAKLNAQQWEDLDTDSFQFVPISADKKPEKLILFKF